MSGKLGGFSWAFTQERRTGEGCGPFREKQACRFSVNILFVCLFCLSRVATSHHESPRVATSHHERVATSRYESPRANRHEPTQEPTKPQQATGYLHAATSPTSRHESPHGTHDTSRKMAPTHRKPLEAAASRRKPPGVTASDCESTRPPKNREAPASREPPQGRPEKTTARQPRADPSPHEPQRVAARQPASRPEHPQGARKTPASPHEPPQAVASLPRTTARRQRDNHDPTRTPQGDRKTPASHCEPPRATRKADPRRRNEPRPGPQTRRGRTNQVESQTRRSHRTRPQARRVADDTRKKEPDSAGLDIPGRRSQNWIRSD